MHVLNALRTGVLAALTLVPASAARAEQITVLDEESGQPVRGAWVVVAQESDVDRNGELDAWAGFTARDGSVTLRSSFEGACHVSVVAPGYRALVRTEPRLAATSELRLRPESTTGLHWAWLTGANTAGAQVRGEDGERLGVVGPRGRVALPFHAPGTVRAESPMISPVSWDLDPAVSTTWSEPLQVSARPRSLAPVEVSVVASPGVTLDRGRTGVAVGGLGCGWIQAKELEEGSWVWSARANPRSRRVALVLCGRAWALRTLEVGAESVELQVGAVPLQPVSVELFSAPGQPIGGWGRYEIFLESPETHRSGLEPVRIVRGELDGETSISERLQPGEYRIDWVTSTFTKSEAFTVEAGADLTRSHLYAFHPVHPASSPPQPLDEGATGDCTVRILAPGVDYSKAKVMLLDPITSRIHHAAEVLPDQDAEFRGVAAGGYEVHVVLFGDFEGLARPLGGAFPELAVVESGSERLEVTMTTQPRLEVAVAEVTSDRELVGLLQGVEVRALDADGEVLASATTDGLGVATFEAPEATYAELLVVGDGLGEVVRTELPRNASGVPDGRAYVLVARD